MWSQQTTISLIKDLEHFPSLWDVQCIDYRNRANKIDVLDTLAKKYNVNTVEIEKKIQALKNQFRREHKKLLDSQKYGSPPKTVNWFGYKHLLFLREGYEARGGHSTDCFQEMTKDIVDKLLESNVKRESIEEDSENETSISESSTIGFREAVTTRKIKIDDYNAMEAFQCMKTLTETVSSRDEYAIFGEHIANKLRNSGRSNFEIVIAQHEIDNICFKLTMGGYSQITHSVTQSSPSSNSAPQSPIGSPDLSISSEGTSPSES